MLQEPERRTDDGEHHHHQAADQHDVAVGDGPEGPDQRDLVAVRSGSSRLNSAAADLCVSMTRLRLI